ncbi:hypothetical protein ACIOWI_29740 [Streptomyces sp. NPDC087659]|uniref:hypothetical protein n=1 Tax=Streptomyces sp. NPDC087659 TaxID=3365801 RepID=UPI003801994B
MTGDQVRAELDQLQADETAPGMAAVARKLADALDGTTAATTMAVVSRELRAIMSDLRKLAPVGAAGDTVDEVTQLREKRRAEAQMKAAGD